MKKSLFIIAILSIVAVLYIAIISIFDIYWTASDDSRYIFASSGSYTGQPSSYLVYLGFIFGTFVSFLYSFYNGIEWFTCVYYLLFILSVLVLCYCILKSKLNEYFKYTLLVGTVLINIYFALNPQSTFLATHLSFTSVVLLLVCRNKGALVTSLLLFFIATQLRLMAAFIPFVIAFPLFYHEVNINCRCILKKSLRLILFLLPVALTLVTNHFAYNCDSEWQHFLRYDKARCYIADNPQRDKLKLQLSNNEDILAYELFAKYRYYDENILPLEKMEKYASDMRHYSLDNIKENILQYVISYVSYGAILLFVLFLYLICILYSTKDYKYIFLCGFSLLIFVSANLYMSAQSYPKDRVMHGAFFVLGFTVTFTISKLTSFKSQKLLAGIMLLMSMLYIYKAFSTIHNNGNQDKVSETEMMILEAKAPKVFMSTPTTLIPEVFHTSSSPIATNTIIHGWMQIYPESNEKYRNLTAFVNGMPMLVDKNSMEQVDLVLKLLYLHYHISATASVLKESQHYNLVKIEK